MAKVKTDLREELKDYKFEFEIRQRIPCSKQENEEYQKTLNEGGTLPEGVYAYLLNNGERSCEFYTVYETDMDESEIKEYLSYKQLKYIKTIKNCVLLLSVLTVIFLFMYLLVLLSTL